MKDKRDLLRLHRWIALFLSPLLFLQALTGSVLLFREELAGLVEPLAQARPSPEGDAPVSALVSSAEAAQPGFSVVRIFLPADARSTAFAQMRSPDSAGMRYAAVDPGSGQVLATGAIWRFPLEAALQIHYRLIDGRFGMAVILLDAVGLIFLSITGLLFWWPGRERAARALAIGQGPPRVRLRQWHRSIGVILTPLILFSAATGALLVLPDVAAPAAPGGSRPIADAGRIDRAVARAQAEFPGARPRDIRFPAADLIDVNFHAPRRNTMAVDVVSVSLSDGVLTRRLRAEDNPALWISVLPLHSGSALGLGGRLVLLFGAIAIMVLALTGPLMWWQARRGRRKG